MIQEAYCSYEVAKLLNEKGFVQETLMVYNQNGNFMPNGAIEDTYQVFYSAPTHQMAMAWLREHGLHINAVISYDYSVDADGNEVDRWTFWLFEIFSSFSGNLIYTEEVNQYDSYKEAIEAALKYVLENLI